MTQKEYLALRRASGRAQIARLKEQQGGKCALCADTRGLEFA
jgi:hypothetical protein